MKLKKCFPGLLWPKGKEKQNSPNDAPEDNPFAFPEQPLYPWAGEWVTIVAIITMLILLFIGINAKSQNALKIGDQVPDITLSPILNCPRPAARLTDFRGKYLILDFWATWCGGCIAAFPKLEKLQVQFKDQLQILGVAYEDSAKISRFFKEKTGPDGRPFRFPSLTQDVALSRLFPHQLIPHCVWIDPQGKVAAITDADSVNQPQLEHLLQTGQADLVTKKDIRMEDPLFLADQLPLDSLAHYTILIKNNYGGLGSGLRLRKSGSAIRGCAVTNSSLLTVYEAAIRPLFKAQGDSYSNKRLVLQVSDPRKVQMNKLPDGSWDTSNNYNFDFIIPVSAADSLYHWMLADLNRYSGYTGRILTRPEKCLLLVDSGPDSLFASKGGKAENSLFYREPARLINEPLSLLAARLNDLPGIPCPVLDESGYQGKADLRFSAPFSLPHLRAQLQSAGLDLVEAVRPIRLFILQDQSSPMVPPHLYQP